MKKILALLMITLVAVTWVSAQVTTASMTGRVSNHGGKALSGASVRATHQPSGTSYGVSTSAEGRYTIQGMRVGGPYKVEISYMGAQTETIDNITLKLGETTNISVRLRDGVQALEAVTVRGKTGIDASKTGAAANINADQIARIPSISGSVADVLRLNPQISVSNSGAMFFSGTNNRYNSFQIDGAMNNDVFGLTANGSNGGQAGTQPVSMETIEQIHVNVAPYDVRQSGFTGGAINAITKSGGNTLHASIYGFGNNQSLIGSKFTRMDGKESEKYTKQTEYRTGVTIGGPILRNKLFFFANYERANKTYPNPYGLGAGASHVDEAQANEVLARIKEIAAAQGVTYNGNFSSKENYTLSDKAGLKLNWNINENHKASFRWALVSAKQLNSNSSAYAVSSSDYTWDFVSKTNSFIGELQSRLGDRASNELRASYVRVRDQRVPGSPSPMISISGVGDGSLNLGSERSSVANRLDQDIISLTDNLTWYLGRHTLTAGTHNEFYNFANLFIQDNYGTYYYNSVDDFMAGKINSYRYSQANVDVTGNPRWEAAFSTAQLGFYLQDKWNVTDKLDLTLGARIDMPLFFDTPAENSGFNAYAATKGWDYKTNSKVASSPLFSPRVGFRYEIDDQSRFVLRGGAGVFTGRIPFVWISNNFSNTGIQLSTYNVNAAAVESAGLGLLLDPYGQKPNVDKLTAGGSQLVNVFDKNFKFAQNLRLNLGFDFELGGIEWTAEAMWSKTLNDILYQNLAYQKSGQGVQGADFDQRPTFSRVTTGEGAPYSLIYALSNTNKGYTYNLSLMGQKSFKFGLDLMASYTFTRSKAANSGTSSVAQSNWAYNYTRGDSNDPELGFSAFNFPHKINVSAFYHKNYGKQDRWTSTIGVIYTGSSGAPYSIYYNGDINGDSSTGNDLLFIPTDQQIDQMTFRPTATYDQNAQRANMKAWIAGDDYLSKHRGEYFERYTDNEDFEHQFDIHLAQKLNFNSGGKLKHSLELTFDIINAGNLFCKTWGRHANAGGMSTYYSPVNYNGGQYQFLHDGDYNMRSYSDYLSRWRGQIGLKYMF